MSLSMFSPETISVCVYFFTKYDGMDPEVRFGDNGWASGVDLGLYPQSRTVMFGLSADF